MAFDSSNRPFGSAKEAFDVASDAHGPTVSTVSGAPRASMVGAKAQARRYINQANTTGQNAFSLARMKDPAAVDTWAAKAQSGMFATSVFGVVPEAPKERGAEEFT